VIQLTFNMKTFTTEHEARAAVEDAMKQWPGSKIKEVHVDSNTDHNWYVYVYRQLECGREILFKCKWSSPIIRFK